MSYKGRTIEQIYLAAQYFDEGYAAYSKGQPREDNPYHQRTYQYRHWDEGWCDAYDEEFW